MQGEADAAKEEVFREQEKWQLQPSDIKTTGRVLELKFL